jgi:hypothetical protein
MVIPASSTSVQPLSQRSEHGGRKTGLRFTRDGSGELESYLAQICERVRAGVQAIIPARKLEALILGGGYGRGEGGVLKTESGDRPYNDLEFYVCVRGNRFLSDWRYTRALYQLAHELSLLAEVEIEFKIISLAHLRRSPITMFSYDLVMGHRWLQGNEALLQGCEHLRDAGALPLSEATRLLMNRCSGLLFAREQLEQRPLTVDAADFVGRNLAKARLAFGDVVLTSFGQYHWSCLERQERLLGPIAPLPWFPDVRSLHAAGVDFKLHPQRAGLSTTELRSEFEQLRALGLSLWLWLENRRLGSSFKSARDYAMSSINKCPGTNPWRNQLVNVNAFGPLTFCRRRSFRHPRERVLNALALFLWESWDSDPQVLRHLRRELRMRAEDRNIVGAYRALWARFN